MKKLLAVLVVLTMVLVGCGKTDTPTDKVEIALMVGNIGDLSFNDSAWEGMGKVKTDFGSKVNVTLIEYGSDTTKEEPALLDAAEGKYDLIISSSTMKTYLEKHAAAYPDKKFIMFDETIDYATYPLNNVYSIQYKANEASYLVGFVGAKLSETGVLGFLGGMDLPIINDFLLGFIEGAQYANPNVKVSWKFAGEWGNPAKGKELSQAMLTENADIIFGVAGGTGMGAIELAAEETQKHPDKPLYAIGVDSDQALILDAAGKVDLAKVILTSALKNVGASLYRAVDLYLKDELKFGEVEVLGIAEGGVGIAINKYYEALVSTDIRAEVEALNQKVVAGEISISSAYGKTTAEIESIRNTVKP